MGDRARPLPTHIRSAHIDDAQRIADLHVRTWQHAYRGYMPDAFLDALDVGARAAWWRDILTRATREVLVSEVGA